MSKTLDNALREVVGTVSESGGVLTGAIIERGDPGGVAGGHYLKLADGTLICWATDMPLTYSSAGFVYGTWTYPEPFIAEPVVTHQPVANSSALTYRDFAVCTADNIGPLSAGLSISSDDDSTGFTSGDIVTVHVLAIGRWF